MIQALVSFVQDQSDSIQSVHAGDTTYVFLVKSHLILASVSKTGQNEIQLQNQLKYLIL